MRLLVIEDERDLRLVLANALRDAGYAVDEGADGQEGLHKAMQWEYDAIVLDLMMPKMSGWDFLAAFRKRFKTPVLVLTARDTIEDRVRGLDDGADDYLIKPFELNELLARVRALIRRAAGHAHARIEIGEVVIDTVSKTVSHAGHDIVLTAREYTVLELLAIQRGKLVSRHRIYDHIFDEQDEALSNLVEVHISNLRKKLGKDFIKTRRGMGYLIEA